MDDKTVFYVKDKKLVNFINEPLDAKMPMLSCRMKFIIMKDNSPDPDLFETSPAEQPKFMILKKLGQNNNRLNEIELNDVESLEICSELTTEKNNKI